MVTNRCVAQLPRSAICVPVAAVSVYVIQIKASNNFSFSLAFDAVHFPTFEGDAQSAMLLSVLVWFEALVELRGCGVGFDQMRPAVRGNSFPSTAILVFFGGEVRKGSGR